MDAACIRVRGQVQGVGFRPFIWQLARRHEITGEVLNDAEGVLIRARGPMLDAFERAIFDEAPPLARVDHVERVPGEVPQADDFTIAASGPSGAETRVTPDAATCGACVEEIRGSGRRKGYAFTNCTHCGPRFTILQSLPYDRAKTTMAPFEMCPDCAAEYSDPADRRFHAQPIACPACGPRLWLEPEPQTGADEPIEAAARRLQAGDILAIKGLGGFHLACDARNATAVAKLRERKRRPAKPFALMGRLDDLRALAELDDQSCALLQDAAAPIVLVRWKDRSLPETLAPGMAHLGVMLPYTPLHHLLLDAFGGVLVMTSGNLSGEPQVVGNDEAREKLTPFVDAFLMHNREIARRLDDGVEVAGPVGPMVLRRARGRVPGTLPLPEGLGDAQVVAYGGQMKAAICLTKNGQAVLSHHLGELDRPLTVAEFHKADQDLAALFDHVPEAVAVDLHPDFHATRHGEQRAEADTLPVHRIQHHHAHLAAAMGEHGWPVDAGPVAGIILDGLGLGHDGTVWGGELLIGDYRAVERAHWIEPAPLIGGDRAQSEPWRNALVRLDAAGQGDWADDLFPDLPRDAVRQAARAGLGSVQSTSAGRLFDAFAACLNLCPARQSYEGEAAMRLEGLAWSAFGAEVAPLRFAVEGSVIRTDAVFERLRFELRAGRPPSELALGFHLGLATCFAERAREVVASGKAKAVALSGGCFQNQLLLRLTLQALGDVKVLVPSQVPANDGGLAYGQALVALAQMESQ